MVDLTLEPLSPELVLVAPELRARAIEALPPPPWAVYPPVRIRPLVPAARVPRSLLREATLQGARALIPAGVAVFVVVMVTLVLTMVAGAVR